MTHDSWGALYQATKRDECGHEEMWISVYACCENDDYGHEGKRLTTIYACSSKSNTVTAIMIECRYPYECTPQKWSNADPFIMALRSSLAAYACWKSDGECDIDLACRKLAGNANDRAGKQLGQWHRQDQSEIRKPAVNSNFSCWQDANECSQHARTVVTALKKPLWAVAASRKPPPCSDWSLDLPDWRGASTRATLCLWLGWTRRELTTAGPSFPWPISASTNARYLRSARHSDPTLRKSVNSKVVWNDLTRILPWRVTKDVNRICGYAKKRD